MHMLDIHSVQNNQYNNIHIDIVEYCWFFASCTSPYVPLSAHSGAEEFDLWFSIMLCMKDEGSDIYNDFVFIILRASSRIRVLSLIAQPNSLTFTHKQIIN